MDYLGVNMIDSLLAIFFKVEKVQIGPLHAKQTGKSLEFLILIITWFLDPKRLLLKTLFSI